MYEYSNLVYNKVCNKSDIVLGLTSVINSLPDKENKALMLNQLCMPFAQEILKVAIEVDQDVDPRRLVANDHIKTVVANLDKLTLISKNLSPASVDQTDHVMVGVLNQMWKLLEKFLERYYVGVILTAG